MGHIDVGELPYAPRQRPDAVAAVGSRVALISAPFTSPVGVGRMGAGGVPQGGELELVHFSVDRAVKPQAWQPRALPRIVPLERTRVARNHTFRFNSAMMQHDINGRMFDMERIDETVRFGDSELWTFVNDRPFSHPVHVHEVQCQIVIRTGGRGRIMPLNYEIV